MFSKSVDEFFRRNIVFLLIFSVTLIIFSLSYTDLRYGKITGLQSEEGESGGGFIEPGGEATCRFFDFGGPCVFTSIIEYNKPPLDILNKISDNSKIASQSAIYSIDIVNLAKSNFVSETELIRYKTNIGYALDSVIYEYNYSKTISKDYSSVELSTYLESMVNDIDIIEDSFKEINSKITETVSERQDFQRGHAEWTLDHQSFIEDSIDLLVEDISSEFDEDYNSKYSLFISNYVDNNKLIEQCVSDISGCSNSSNCPSYIYLCIISDTELNSPCEGFLDICLENKVVSDPAGNNLDNSSNGTKISGNGSVGFGRSGLPGGSGRTGGGEIPCIGNQCEDLPACNPPDYLLATNPSVFDFGNYGTNSVTGDICYIGKLEVYSRSSSIFKPSNNSTNVSNSVVSSGRSSGRDLKVIHFKSRNGANVKDYAATILSRDSNGQLNINFLSALDYNGLESKIDELVSKILFSPESLSGSYLTRISLQNAEKIIEDSNEIPWILWIILFMMLFVFVFYEKLFSLFKS
ncbi:MAG: hypothetical protein AABW89_01855 [Nanoarchaeota archaeon]